MESKYADKVLSFLSGLADCSAQMPTMRRVAEYAGCPVSGYGRMSQVIKALERDGKLERYVSKGVTTHVRICATGAMTKPKPIPVLPVNCDERPPRKPVRKAKVKAVSPPRARKPKPPKKAAKPARLVFVPRKRPGHPDGCQWIEGEPKDRQFCGKDTLPDSPWCAEHHEICHLKTGLQKTLFNRTKTTVDDAAMVA